jgi:formylglycine-generating enzyme required for sulfatase activity
LVSKDALIEAAWPGQAVEESNLTVQIAALRRVLGEVPGGDRWIVTMPRRGYRYIGPVVTEVENGVTAPAPQADTARDPVITPHAEAERHRAPYTRTEPIEKRDLNLWPEHAALSDPYPLRLDALQAEAWGDPKTAEKLWRRVIVASSVEPPAHEAVKQIAQKEASAPAPAPVSESRQPPAASGGGAARLSRRRLLTFGALGAAGAGAIAAVPFVRRKLLRPALRMIHFDFASVDENGRQQPPQRASAAVFTEALGSGTGLDMVAVPSGSFTMGSPDNEPERRPNEDPQRHVTLTQFFIGAAPITQAQWLAVVMAHPAKLQHDLNPNPSFFRGIDLPVESITWYEAEEYCRRLAIITGRDYRLPSEAEWEYACRAGTVSPFNVGPTITTDLANYCGAGGAVCGDNFGKSIASDYYNGVNYGSGAYAQGPTGAFRGVTTRAGTFLPNRFGLYDMHGNVWEYCLDIAAPYNDAPTDGSAFLSRPDYGNRIVRGGSWSHNPAICRSAYRDGIAPDSPGWQGRVGMRVICGG